jgi:hypothetical protein
LGYQLLILKNIVTKCYIVNSFYNGMHTLVQSWTKRCEKERNCVDVEFRIAAVLILIHTLRILSDLPSRTEFHYTLPFVSALCYCTPIVRMSMHFNIHVCCIVWQSITDQ